MTLLHRQTFNDRRKPTANSTFAIGGVSCSADSLVVAESSVLRIKFSGKNPAHRKSATRYLQRAHGVCSQVTLNKNCFLI